MHSPRAYPVLRFEISSFEVGNGGLEGRLFGGRGWDFGRVVPEVFGFAKGAIPHSDRSAPENSC